MGGTCGETTSWRPSALAARLGLLEILLAPSMIALVAAYHVLDDSSMAGIVWLYSFPTAVLCFALPGILLRRTRWVGWVSQILPLALLCWLGLLASSVR